MFVIESCQKIEYNVLFMMIFIPVSNFGDQSLDVKLRHKKDKKQHILNNRAYCLFELLG